MQSWVFLTGAILAEVVGTIALRSSQGFTRTLPVLVVVAGYATAFYLLSLALRQFDIGFAYAVWAGAGTALIAIIGVIAFGEPASLLKVLGVLLVIGGVVVLNLGGAH